VDARSVKNWLVTIALALVACGVSFGAFYALNREPAALRAAARAGDALEWMRVEFKLSGAQYAAIRQLHEDYGSLCTAHCNAIMAAEKRHAPRSEVETLESECVQSMTDHFHRVAAIMSPEQGQRYLAIVMPRVHDYDHRGAPNLQARP
jgi:hypothetical protein